MDFDFGVQIIGS